MTRNGTKAIRTRASLSNQSAKAKVIHNGRTGPTLRNGTASHAHDDGISNTQG